MLKGGLVEIRRLYSTEEIKEELLSVCQDREYVLTYPIEETLKLVDFSRKEFLLIFQEDYQDYLSKWNLLSSIAQLVSHHPYLFTTLGLVVIGGAYSYFQNMWSFVGIWQKLVAILNYQTDQSRIQKETLGTLKKLVEEKDDLNEKVWSQGKELLKLMETVGTLGLTVEKLSKLVLLDHEIPLVRHLFKSLDKDMVNMLLALIKLSQEELEGKGPFSGFSVFNRKTSTQKPFDGKGYRLNPEKEKEKEEEKDDMNDMD